MYRKLGLLTKIYNYFLDKGQCEQGAVEIFHCDRMHAEFLLFTGVSIFEFEMSY